MAAATAILKCRPVSIGIGIGNSQLADMAEATIKGRAVGAGTGAPTDLTPAQVLTILGISTGGGGNYATVADAIASTAIATETDLTIKGRRWTYTASTPGHAAYFTNTNSSRKYELNVDAITEDIIADSEIFNGDRDAAALSGYRTNTPLNMSDGYATLVLNPITEDATNTDVGRMAVVNAVTEYIGDCVCTGGSYIEWTIPSVGEIAVDGGQIVWGDLDIPAPTNPLIINAPAPDTNIISAISFAGSKTSRVVYCYVSSGGTGYSSSFSVTATGGGGSGFAGTAYAVGGVIQAIVVTNGGSGWTSAPTLDLSAGGGSGAAAYAEINKDIVSVTVTLTSALPSYMAVGMPFGLRDVDGDNDADWLQGAGIVSAFNTGTKTITFDYSIPSATLPTSPTTITTTGTKSRVYFFPTWFTVKGGYGGGATGKEAFINATRNGHIRLYNLACAWSASSQTQANKYNPSGAHVGGLNGSIHFYESCCFVGFPNFQVRYFQGDGFSTLLFLGGATTGFSGMRMQGGGKGQFGYVHAGGFRAGTAALQALDGNYMEISVLTVGAASTGVDCTGQDVNLANGKIAGCTVGMSCSKGGNLNVGSSSVTIKRCNVGQQFSTGGKIIGDPTFTSSISLDCLVPVNSAYQGGGWLSNAASEITRYYFTSAIFHGYGAGTPEGAVAASIGSLWSRSDGGASTTLYVKQSGTGNTGWVAK